jgi:hypothetical protein
MWKEAALAKFNVLPRQFPGRINENTRETQSGLSVSRPGTEPSTSKYRSETLQLEAVRAVIFSDISVSRNKI